MIESIFNFTMKKRSSFLLIVLLVPLSLLFVLKKNFLSGISSQDSQRKNFELVERVIFLIRNEYVEEPDPVATMEGAYRGLINSLDPLSGYLSKENVVKYLQNKEKNLREIGVILYKKNEPFPLIMGILDNSPAQKREMKIGDYISAIDDRSTLLMSLSEADLSLKDREEKPIKIKLLRENRSFEITVERISFSPEPISYLPEKDFAGILRIHHFYPPVFYEIKRKFFSQLIKQTDPLIIDLRNCHEGNYEEARKFLNLFLKSEKIGYFQKKGDVRENIACPEDAPLEKNSLFIWTNQATMGPAEMVAGVLQDFKRAKVIGTSTPGLVGQQRFFPLEDGSGILLTSGVFFLSSGKKLWQQGITSDVPLKRDETSAKSYLDKTRSLLHSLNK